MNRNALILGLTFVVILSFLYYQGTVVHPPCETSETCVASSYCIRGRCESLENKIVICGPQATAKVQSLDLGNAWLISNGKKRKFSVLAATRYVLEYPKTEWKSTVIPFINCDRILKIPDGVPMPESN